MSSGCSNWNNTYLTKDKTVMADFIHEWKKLLACLVGIVFLLAITHFTGQDMTAWIKQLLDLLVLLLGAGAVKYSVLSTSERKNISRNNNTGGLF